MADKFMNFVRKENIYEIKLEMVDFDKNGAKSELELEEISKKIPKRRQEYFKALITD